MLDRLRYSRHAETAVGAFVAAVALTAGVVTVIVWIVGLAVSLMWLAERIP